MRTLLLAATALCLSGFANAQDTPKPDKNNEEIIIRNNGDKDMNMTIQINGDSILVNGKPLSEYNDNNVTINKRKIMIRDGDNDMSMDFGPGGMGAFNFNENGDDDETKDMLKNLNGKKITKPFLGVTTEKDRGGVKITEIVEGCAAAKAGLKEGDIITKIGDDKIDDPETLSKVIKSKKPHEEVKVYYIRDGKEKNVKTTLGEKTISMTRTYSFNGPNMRGFKMPELPQMPDMSDMYGPDDMRDAMMPRQKRLGLKIQDTEEGQVKVIDVEDSSAAAKAGLQKGDIIIEIDGEKVNNTDEAREQLHPEEGKNSYKIKVNRNGSDVNLEIKIPRKLKTANL